MSSAVSPAPEDLAAEASAPASPADAAELPATGAPPLRRWVQAGAGKSGADPAERAASFAAAVGCPPVVARLLLSRGHTPETAGAFLEPSPSHLHDPALMLGMSAAVARIESALRASEPVLIYGDYDVDGTVATVLLKTAVELAARSLGCAADVRFHIPHRLREGYGMQEPVLAEAAAAGVRLVISVDTGIRAFAAASEARALGLDLLVTDHHLPDSDGTLPQAHAVLNPAQATCPYPNKSLCGAGVAFKLAHALLRSTARDQAERVRLETVLVPSFLKLVAIATVADSVALTGENRVLVALGLRALRNPVQPGLRSLLEVAGLSVESSPSAAEIAFRIAPRINAAGRMDVASDVVDLLLTRDPARARSLAERLDAHNTGRRAAEAEALARIEACLEQHRHAVHGFVPECLVLVHPALHRGVLGILASRVVERTGRPVLVVTEEDGAAHGSGRSVAGFHLLDALHEVHRGELFSRFGGHAQAVGFSLPSDRLPELCARMRLHSASALTPELLLPELVYDTVLEPGEISAELCVWLRRAEPFGNAHPEPVFRVAGLRIAGPPRLIQDRHISLPLTARGGERVPARLQALGWSRPPALDWPARLRELGLREGDAVEMLVRLRENRHPQFGGPELELVDLRAAPGSP